ncbi:MAG: glycoside hydrolase family 15 protein [Gammaproteobacteria bacterium]|nr:glycoside hydrolase family 15 protein [Gammaproteobacteria bacterium]NIM74011.1 glycoside hydrolase family 15 protein [Gammaproteobacteria bacterium]NIN38892.1 glycoside hydrolase family 15 protein [Gammaproteobacteria bacterium]NIO25787.1 glycoside hydrolase family 15 protein [Gammaproteobacteria bacterium]NIO66417.1 glycoside hydrolase family 15 protein [Gammaproteobacteria bacterium]
MSSLDLGVIGNCSFGALIDAAARVVWCCLPRFDADPVFCSLLNNHDGDSGVFVVELQGMTRSEQFYKQNTAILVTRMFDDEGNGIEITDFAPRFNMRGRRFRPMTLIRRLRTIVGTPRIVIRVRPRFDYGATAPSLTHGSNHIRYVGDKLTLRLTTNAPITYVLNETPFCLEEPTSFVLGPDETLATGVEETAREFQERTTEYWRLWVRGLALPLEWQEAVIRAAITLKLCEFEETGAIVAAMTTSVPEAPGTERNWDYRYCWLRDAFFVVRALNGLAAVETMESYLRYLHNIIATSRDNGSDGHMQPVYGIGLERRLEERIVPSLTGYRGMGPVRVGNQAHEHVQHDVYGNAILAGAQAFFDDRLLRQPDDADFDRFESVGERAFQMHDKPDAGMWELRSRSRIHTSSSLMCWAACDRLAKIAAHRGLEDRARLWQERSESVRGAILKNAWNEDFGAFAESFGGDALDAGLLLMAEVGFLEPADPRFQSTLERIESNLRRGNHLFRYTAPDDFGVPRSAFNICTFWYIDALARTGRVDEAREIFESMLACRNRLGLLSEDIDPETGEHWGNYPQTYSLVGVINCAIRLSRPWQSKL